MTGKRTGRGRGPGAATRRTDRGEDGFSVIELAIVVVLLGIALTVVTINYADTRRGMAMKSATEEVEAAVNRCYSIASQEGVDVYLQFWSGSGAHPNQYAIYRSYPSGVNERTLDQPTENPAAGSSYNADGEGHYWMKLGDGSVKVGAPVTLLFRRDGTVVRVSLAEGDAMAVGLAISDLTNTVYVNAAGEVTY